MHEHYIIMIAIGIVTGVGGMVIGYYKSEANLSKNFMSKKDCAVCVVRTEITTLANAIRNATKDRQIRAEMLTNLRIDIALIKQKLDIREDKNVRELLREKIINGDS